MIKGDKLMHLRKAIPVLAVLAVLALAGLAQAEMYFEGYMGGAFPLASRMGGTVVEPGSTHNSGAFVDFAIHGGYKPAFQGGGKLGLWFDKSGVLSSINFRPWMKYFGFYLDLSYHRLDIGRERAQAKFTEFGEGKFVEYGSFPFSSEGDAFTLAFMFAARYGFLKDSEVPFGRLQPYLAVGPAILFSSQHPNIAGIKLESSSAVSPALAVETGLRWMALKNVSVDVSFKYRYAKPSYDFNYRAFVTNGFANNFVQTYTNSISMSPTLHILSFQIGAAYHF